MSVNLPSTFRAGRHRYGIRVYFEDTDAGGIVYHANYLRFAERARTEALRDLGIPHAEMVRRHGLMFVVRRAKLDYLRPARLDDSLTVVTAAVAVRGASVLLRQGFELADAQGGTCEAAVLEIQLACVPSMGPGGEARPERIPDEWRLGLERMAAADAASSGGRDG
jgi:acyl-CoA thioester hydrolase